MAALALVRRDLLRYVRNPMRAVLLLAIPLVLAGVFVLVFGGGGGSGVTIEVLVWDEDEGIVSQLLSGAAGSPEMAEQLDLELVGEEGLERIERGEASALVHFPAGFTESYLEGEPVTIRVIKNPAEAFLPRVAEEGARIVAVLLTEIARVFAPELAVFEEMTSTDDWPEIAAVQSLSGGIATKLQRFDKYLFPPVVEIDVVDLEDDAEPAGAGGGILAAVLPGLAVLGLLFFAQSATRDLTVEREQGLTRHVLTAPVTAAGYLLAKALSVLVVSALGFGLLIVVGALAGVDWGPWPAVVLLAAASALAAAGLLLLVTSTARTARQADAVGTIVVMVMALLGGSFFPLSQLPSFVLPVSRLTMNYWAVDGFNTLIGGTGGLAAIAVNVLVLTVSGAVFLAVGAAVLRRRIGSGVV
jgi:ABC-2 type transport system permease protein